MIDDDFLDEGQNNRTISPDLVPLINVVFLLLIFFLVAGKTMTNMDTTFEIPKAKAEQIIEEDAIKITLSLDKRIIIAGHKLSNLEIRSVDLYLQEILKLDLGRQIILEADARLEAIYLTEILQIISDIGCTNIIIGVENAQ